MKPNHGDFRLEDEFLNMVVKVETNLTPSGLLGKNSDDRIIIRQSKRGKTIFIETDRYRYPSL